MGEGPPNGPAPAEAGEGGPQTDSSARLGKTRPEPGPAAPSATRSSSPCDQEQLPCSPLQGSGELPSADDPPAGTQHSPQVLATL